MEGKRTEKATTAAVLGHRRLRVLHVIESLHTTGGAETLLVTLARAINAERYDMRVCSLSKLSNSPIEGDLRRLGIPVYSAGMYSLRDPRRLYRLAMLVRQHNIDIIHTHLYNAITFGALAGSMTKRPVVGTLHNIRPISTFSGLQAVMVAFHVGALRWGTDMIVACGPGLGQASRDQWRLPAEKIVEIANGIDTEAFSSAASARDEQCRRELLDGMAGPLIVTVGNIRKEKGHNYLVTATQRVAQVLPGVRVVIVGRQATGAIALRDSIDSLNLGRHVFLAGEQRDISTILAAADLFVLPSISEGFPLTLLEAMAAGKAVVATAVGGVPHVVEDGVTGRLVPPADPRALAEAIIHLLCQPDEAQRLAARGQAVVKERYGAAAWARQLEVLYSDLAHRTPPRRVGFNIT